MRRSEKSGLSYRAKRDFGITAEPRKVARKRYRLRHSSMPQRVCTTICVVDGVMKAGQWRGPSLVPRKSDWQSGRGYPIAYNVEGTIRRANMAAAL
jgi:hypothetical protein